MKKRDTTVILRRIFNFFVFLNSRLLTTWLDFNVRRFHFNVASRLENPMNNHIFSYFFSSFSLMLEIFSQFLLVPP